MFRKLTAIFLLLVFTWSQYVKQAVYLECRLAMGFKSYAVVCDCEKKAGPFQQEPVKGPLPGSHSHIHPDELYPLAGIQLKDFSLPPVTPFHVQCPCGEPAAGWATLPFQPPRNNRA